MLKRLSAILTVLLLLAPVAGAQSSDGESADAPDGASCGADLSAPLAPETAEGAAQTADARPSDAALTAAAPAAGAAGGGSASSAATGETALSPAEQKVQDIISQDGVHVVRFWAPWCPNSIGEMNKGWDRLVAANEDVTFTFVTVWNEGKAGTQALSEHNIPERVTELTPAPPEKGRLHTFLGRHVYWIPSTWIFHENGERAFAMNYGEMDMSTIQTLIDATQADW